MENKEKLLKEKYEEPKILASYTKEELEEIIKPHGQGDECVGGACGTPQTGGGGCGCGGGGILTNS